jgi:tetratricopeptide (TPR) repeat protein
MCSDWAESDCDRLLPYFGWGIPIGAPYDLAHRPLVPLNARLTHHHPDPKAPTFRSMIPLNPDSYWATSWTFLYNDDIHMPNNLADEKTLLAHFFDYNGNALYYFLQRADELGGIDDATREDLLRKQAALDPDDYYKLGDFLMSRGKADDAADAYRKGAQQGNDAVLFANSIKPLVKYDFEHNQQDEAMTMAKKAADVYSYGGLDTYAWLLCKLNRGPEAVDIEKQIQQRYGGDPLPEFYVAHPDLFPKESAAVIQRYYPNGLPTVTLADFTAPPIDGDRFDTESPETKRAGLQAGDVVVALDAHPVHSGAEYALIRAMSDSPELDLIVWRSGKYFEIKASPPERSFHIKASTYRAP